MSTAERSRPQFHNLTIYVREGDVAPTAQFYRDVLGLQPVFEEPDHIACFELLDHPSVPGSNVALCVHEQTAGHPAGTTELFFWTDAFATLAERAAARGYRTSRIELTTGAEERQATDPAGVQVRLHRSPAPARE